MTTRSKRKDCPKRYTQGYCIMACHDIYAERVSRNYRHWRGPLAYWFGVLQREYAFLTKRDRDAFLADFRAECERVRRGGE